MRNTQFWEIHFWFLVPNWCLSLDAWAKRKSLFKNIEKIIDFLYKDQRIGYLIFWSICNLHSKRSKSWSLLKRSMIFLIFLWFTLEKVRDFKYHTNSKRSKGYWFKSRIFLCQPCLPYWLIKFLNEYCCRNFFRKSVLNESS